MAIGHIRQRRWQTSRPTRDVLTDRKRQVNAIAQQNDQYNRGPGQKSWVTTGATPAGSGVLCVISHFIEKHCVLRRIKIKKLKMESDKSHKAI